MEEASSRGLLFRRLDTLLDAQLNAIPRQLNATAKLQAQGKGEKKGGKEEKGGKRKNIIVFPPLEMDRWGKAP